MQALILRGAALGLIGDARKKSLYVQLSTKGWRKNEPVTVGRESPFLLWTLLSRHYGERPYRPAADAASHRGAVDRCYTNLAFASARLGRWPNDVHGAHLGR
jgi:hypothetical protein